MALAASRANSPVEEYRSPGSFAIPRAITASNATGKSDRTPDTTGGGEFKCACNNAGKPSTGNGRTPVKHSNNTHVNE